MMCHVTEFKLPSVAPGQTIIYMRLKPYHVVKTDWSYRYDVGHLLRGC